MVRSTKTPQEAVASVVDKIRKKVDKIKKSATKSGNSLKKKMVKKKRVITREISDAIHKVKDRIKHR